MHNHANGIHPWFYPAQPNPYPYQYRHHSVIPHQIHLQAPWSGDAGRSQTQQYRVTFQDYGPQPFTIDIEEAAEENTNYRNALWTGKHLQLTLMSIPVGGDIGLEMHPDVDQFLRIEEGQGVVRMGSSQDSISFQRRVKDGYVILIPAGTWHNLINTGNSPLKLYSIYAPPEHPHGTVHRTKAEAAAAEQAAQRES